MKRPEFLTGLAVLVACSQQNASHIIGGGGRSTHPHWLRVADGSGDPHSLNPHLYTEFTVGLLSELTMAYLVRYDHSNQPQPELATVLPTYDNGGISRDGKTITWHLRKGVRWSDGTPFTADDVVFSTNAVNNPANNETGRDGWDLIEKIDKPDNYTVVYHLRKPYAAFMPTFFGTGGANPCILPKHILGSLPNINNAPYNSKPVGIGPFRYVEWRRGDAIELEANPYYWRGTPKLKRITYKLIPDRNTLTTLMQTGDVDLWPTVPTGYIDKMKAIGTLNVIAQPSYFFTHLALNLSRPLLQDVRVRQAIRYAIDRKAIVEKIGHGYGIVQDSFVTPVMPIAPKNIPTTPYDPARAKQLLEEAGWTVGPDGVRVKGGQRLSLEFPHYAGAADTDARVEFVRQELRSLGIQLQTRQYAVDQFFAPYQNGGIVYNGKWDLTTFSWQLGPLGEISNLFSNKQIPPNGQNIVHYNNPQVEAWMAAFKNTYDENTHRELLDKEVAQITKDVPYIVFYIMEDAYAYSKNLVGFRPNNMTPFDDFMNVDI